MEDKEPLMKKLDREMREHLKERNERVKNQQIEKMVWFKLNDKVYVFNVYASDDETESFYATSYSVDFDSEDKTVEVSNGKNYPPIVEEWLKSGKVIELYPDWMKVFEEKE
ncbi:MAG: hypothetical protein ACYCZQ_03315 [Burkholderiales bacterium]